MLDHDAQFRALADPLRLRILAFLHRPEAACCTDAERVCACDLESLVGLSQPAVSHHLTLMRIVGLVDYDRNGKHNYYYLASDYLRDLFEQFFTDLGGERHTLEFDEFSIAYERKPEA